MTRKDDRLPERRLEGQKKKIGEEDEVPREREIGGRHPKGFSSLINSQFSSLGLNPLK